MKLKKSNIIQMQEYLDERKEIMKFGNPANKVYYDGMIHAIRILGMDVIFKEGKHIIIY